MKIKLTCDKVSTEDNKTFSVKGNASSESAGVIAAIADQVAKLEPKLPKPIISLQNDSR